LSTETDGPLFVKPVKEVGWANPAPHVATEELFAILHAYAAIRSVLLPS